MELPISKAIRKYCVLEFSKHIYLNIDNIFFIWHKYFSFNYTASCAKQNFHQQKVDQLMPERPPPNANCWKHLFRVIAEWNQHLPGCTPRMRLLFKEFSLGLLSTLKQVARPIFTITMKKKMMMMIHSEKSSTSFLRKMFINIYRLLLR